MPENTEQKILSAARQCFFQHGYKATNMTLISEYAGFSRATVHKYFKNKDDAFRQVCQQLQQQASAACIPILQKELDCWQSIHAIAETWLKPTFDEVSDQRIVSDLKYHVQHVAQDIFNEARQSIEDMLTNLLENAASQQKITFEYINIQPRMLAKLLVASLDGLRGHLEKPSLEQASLDILKIFQQACQPNR
ncbi:MAG: TetR/AcrR family transcriptional regulator [Gammaproteobacteria bacterium]|nr:TetR/AcrR family transcriptional regulator [Gammaproteobacteria bacterium]